MTAMTSSPQPAATGRPAYTQTFPCEPESARRARLLVAIALGAWDLACLADAGKLIVSELVANSVEHTACHHIRVTISRPAQDRVRIAVIDKDTREPTPRAASEEDEHGRGLFIVTALAADTGTDRFRWGKRVWADLLT
jgi:anti-sigma regulatory factor (Ser/Thr protein kinase)